MLSVLSGHTDCVYSLFNKGASVEAKDKWHRTALHLRVVRRDGCTRSYTEREGEACSEVGMGPLNY